MVPDFASFRGFLVLGGNQVRNEGGRRRTRRRGGFWHVHVRSTTNETKYTRGAKFTPSHSLNLCAQVSSIFDKNWVTGQAQSGLWLGKTDDLWGFGKPQGWGAVWRYTPVTLAPAGVATISDPFLMTGFDKKVLHLRCDGECSLVSFAIDVDFTGSAGHLGSTDLVEPWSELELVDVGEKNYAYFAFPAGFSAHWVRVRALQGGAQPLSVNLTAHFSYT